MSDQTDALAALAKAQAWHDRMVHLLIEARDARDAAVVAARVAGCPKATVAETAHLTEERVRQIYAQALKGKL